MKVKTTKKSIVESTPANKLVSAGYCDLYTLLGNHEPIAYTCGIYGWNFDVYMIDGLTICTGYRNMPGRRAKNIKKYEDRARKIAYDWNRPYEERTEELEKLLKEFIEQA